MGFADAMSARLLSQFDVAVGKTESLGKMAFGERRVVAIDGGRASGSLSGVIRGGGADWQWLRHDGVTEISARYVLETPEGEAVEIHSDGYRHGPAEVMARLARGEAVAPDEYYFRTALRFATASARWQRLNGLLAVGVGERRSDRVLIGVYEIV
ncbi:MAG TPA: DUF3237 family protein [Rhodocyclaceae bacterium]|nr:DUF3237 family protein [Rhodocyclaceae bacterium]